MLSSSFTTAPTHIYLTRLVRSSPIQAFWGARSTSASVGTISKFLRWFKKNCKISIDRGEQRLFFSTLIWINQIFLARESFALWWQANHQYGDHSCHPRRRLTPAQASCPNGVPVLTARSLWRNAAVSNKFRPRKPTTEFLVASEYWFRVYIPMCCTIRRKVCSNTKRSWIWMENIPCHHCAYRTTCLNIAGQGWSGSIGRNTLYSRTWIGVSRKYDYYNINYNLFYHKL